MRIIMNSGTLPKWFLCLFALIVLLGAAAGCTEKQSNEELIVTKVEITEIIDKTTRMPITNNTINLRWETEDGELIYTEDHVGKKA